MDPAQREAAFVLHRRPLRETSAVVDLLTRTRGRVAAVLRGARGSAKARPSEPFILLEVSWRGRGQLPTVTSIESLQRVALTGDWLFAGMYLNEMLVRALREEEPMPELFRAYAEALEVLQSEGPIEACLRTFELGLLRELGYELDCHFDAETGEPIVPDGVYKFVEGHGFAATSATDAQGFRGEVLAAIQLENFDREDARRAAKRLLRAALRPHVGDRPFASRALFRRPGR